MKVSELYTRDAKSCRPEMDLANAGWMMWEADCGALPVLDAQGKVVGMLTDRDICMAAITQGRRASDIKVSDVISGKVYSCTLDDDIRDALKIMRTQQVRRLPVVNDQGGLQGILSMNDLVLHARANHATKSMVLAYEDVMLALKAISKHRGESQGQPEQPARVTAKV